LPRVVQTVARPRLPTRRTSRSRRGARRSVSHLLVRSRPLSLQFAHSDPTAAPLLDLDPELGAHVPAEHLDRVRRGLRVTVARIASGRRELGALVGTGGFLMLEGLAISRLALAGTVSIEPLGPGDVILPPTSEVESGPLSTRQAWSAAGAVKVAILPEALPTVLSRSPGLATAFLERAQRRAERARVLHAIATVTRVDVRILALLWHLAGRWGRVTPEGVLLRAPLTHRLLAELIGARRPTVTTALGQLERTGALSRRDGDTWVLHGSPPAASPDEAGILTLP
jgi:CRP/FNR family cyclic AMP-dependent transcriptional regulator